MTIKTYLRCDMIGVWYDAYVYIGGRWDWVGNLEPHGHCHFRCVLHHVLHYWCCGFHFCFHDLLHIWRCNFFCILSGSLVPGIFHILLSVLTNRYLHSDLDPSKRSVCRWHCCFDYKCVGPYHLLPVSDTQSIYITPWDILWKWIGNLSRYDRTLSLSEIWCRITYHPIPWVSQISNEILG